MPPPVYVATISEDVGWCSFVVVGLVVAKSDSGNKLSLNAPILGPYLKSRGFPSKSLNFNLHILLTSGN